MTRTIKTALIGLGNVNRSFLKILEGKAAQIRHQYDLEFCIVGVADSSGIAVDSAGFDPLTLRQFKEAGNKISQLTSYQPGYTASDLFDLVPCDLVLEASPVNLQHGEPGLSVVRAALHQVVGAVIEVEVGLTAVLHPRHRPESHRHVLPEIAEDREGGVIEAHARGDGRGQHHVALLTSAPPTSEERSPQCYPCVALGTRTIVLRRQDGTKPLQDAAGGGQDEGWQAGVGKRCDEPAAGH